MAAPGELLQPGDYARLFTQQRPLLDVRAPIEFAQGAFPGATNLPLIDDEQRHRIGLCYAQEGQDAAIALGHELVRGDLKAARIAAWADWARQNPDGVMYCFRGGMRSQISQQWLHSEGGIALPRIAGGYKALRQFLIDATRSACTALPLLVLGGLTGSGKTELLEALPLDAAVAQHTAALDLEALAHHRGSGFGRHATPQPNQIDFENRLGAALLRLQHATASPTVLVEDESRLIGRCALPAPLRERTSTAPLLWLEEDFDVRALRIHRDYVSGQCAEFSALLGPQEGPAACARHLLDSLDRISRKLGGVRHQNLRQAMQAALDTGSDDPALAFGPERQAAHLAWIAPLLRDYYDPLYAHRLQDGFGGRIVWRGSRDELLERLRQGPLAGRRV
ncbi:tRNA 2-selenouridine(34) synthase MnmH [Amphibiibacter pelophylacis]|uniref:tRNA 2-selenouridine(34) synthase MnmH n=1 Tax=Amphibiibacter pelophylacis TaxID=1799477 RepID=A0ACC6P0R7_9BURK